VEAWFVVAVLLTITVVCTALSAVRIRRRIR
jgi:ABC-type transport system involved in multi-copper enzyme maturation permease subunit